MHILDRPMRYSGRQSAGNHLIASRRLRCPAFLVLALALPASVVAQSSTSTTTPHVCTETQQSSGLVSVTFNAASGSSAAVGNKCVPQGLEFACGPKGASGCYLAPRSPAAGGQSILVPGPAGGPMSVTLVNPLEPSRRNPHPICRKLEVKLLS